MPWIDEKLCAGCNICVQACPVPGAITVQPGQLPVINNDLCTRCGKCMEVCPRNAIRPNSESTSLRGGQAEPGQGQGRGMGRGIGRNAGNGRGGGRGTGRGSGRGRDR